MFSQTGSLAHGRITLAAEAGSRPPSEFEVALLGHCPGHAAWRSLLDMPQALAELRAVGYARQLDRLSALADSTSPPGDASAALQQLFDLPLPIGSVDQFDRLFPQARIAPTRYRTRLTGSSAWLPAAVDDFFAQNPDGRLWLIRVDEREVQRGFLPRPDADPLQTPPAGAWARALALPQVGLIGLPDLERLQVPSELPDIPRLRLDNPDPRFTPCSSEYDDTHRERRNPDEIPRMPEPLPTGALLGPLLRSLHRLRPDVQLLFGLPYADQPEAEQPTLSSDALANLKALRVSDLRDKLHRVQLLYPGLRNRAGALVSASGLLAGRIASSVEQRGSWVSVAGQPISGDHRPWPVIEPQQARALRDEIGIGIFCQQRQQLQLDDERLPAGVFGEPTRSGELTRFIGWLRRELQRLGERLLFDVDPDDPRPLVALNAFFARLHHRGALRGANAEQAFSIRQLPAGEGQLLFEIELTPALPIDHIRLRIDAQRHDEQLRLEWLDG